MAGEGCTLKLSVSAHKKSLPLEAEADQSLYPHCPPKIAGRLAVGEGQGNHAGEIAIAKGHIDFDLGRCRWIPGLDRAQVTQSGGAVARTQAGRDCGTYRAFPKRIEGRCSPVNCAGSRRIAQSCRRMARPE